MANGNFADYNISRCKRKQFQSCSLVILDEAQALTAQQLDAVYDALEESSSEEDDMDEEERLFRMDQESSVDAPPSIAIIGIW